MVTSFSAENQQAPGTFIYIYYKAVPLSPTVAD